MENLYHENRNDFWKYLISIRGQSETENLPQLDNIIDHFKILLDKDEANKTLHEENMNPECSISDNDDTTTSANNNKNKRFESFNNIIEEKELRFTINNLKLKKSPGYDRISNEMLKCTNSQGIKLLTKLFNKILKMGNFPEEWNYGLIKLIHKGNHIYDPNNYRGISLNSCHGKLFCTILYNRLATIFEQENIHCKEVGFRKKHRTTDHVFILRKITRQYTTQSKILYTKKAWFAIRH